MRHPTKADETLGAGDDRGHVAGHDTIATFPQSASSRDGSSLLTLVAYALDGCGNAAMLQNMKTHLLTVQSRGTVALPASLRRRLRLDRADAQIKLIEREDGRIELVPVVAIPAAQAWFWTDRWQAMEREADADIAAGRVVVIDGVDELIGHLDG